jgi:heat shock protein HslJ
MRVPVSLAVLIIALAGCRTMGPATNPLAGTAWHLESLFDAGTEVADVPPDEVSFDAEGRGVRVRSCNSCAGLYTVGDRTLEITQLACTRMACPGRLELDRYLAGRARWALDAHRLVLTVNDALNGIDAVLTFRPAGAPGAE